MVFIYCAPRQCVCCISNRGDGVKGGVGSNAEVWAGHIVRYSSRNDHHGNTQLFILPSALNHLQCTWKCLKRGILMWPEQNMDRMRSEQDMDIILYSIDIVLYIISLHFITCLKTPNDDQSMNIVLSNIQADLLHVLSR